MKLDITRLKNDLKSVAKELQEMKKLFREPGQPNVTRKLYYQRDVLRKQATMCCSIRAHHRNKIHAKNTFSDLAAQLAFIQNELPKYLIAEAA